MWCCKREQARHSKRAVWSRWLKWWSKMRTWSTELFDISILLDISKPVKYHFISELDWANHFAHFSRLILLCASSRNHVRLPSEIDWNRSGQENAFTPWIISCDESSALSCDALCCKKLLLTARVKESFSNWTFGFSCEASAERSEQTSTNSSETFLSAALFWSIVATAFCCGAENAEASALKISALCQATFVRDEPSWCIWSSSIDVIAVTTGFDMTFVASYSPSWWVSYIATSTPSLMKAWKNASASNWRYRGASWEFISEDCKALWVSATYLAKTFLFKDRKFIRILSSGLMRCDEV